MLKHRYKHVKILKQKTLFVRSPTFKTIKKLKKGFECPTRYSSAN